MWLRPFGQRGACEDTLEEEGRGQSVSLRVEAVEEMRIASRETAWKAFAEALPKRELWGKYATVSSHAQTDFDAERAVHAQDDAKIHQEAALRDLSL